MKTRLCCDGSMIVNKSGNEGGIIVLYSLDFVGNDERKLPHQFFMVFILLNIFKKEHNNSIML